MASGSGSSTAAARRTNPDPRDRRGADDLLLPGPARPQQPHRQGGEPPPTGRTARSGLTPTEQAAQLAKVGPLCDGKVACAVLAGLATFGNDPKPNCAKELEVAYKCGSGAATYRVKAHGRQQAVATCVTEESLALSGIRIVSASYGENCRGENAGNHTAAANKACFGRDAAGRPAEGRSRARLRQDVHRQVPLRERADDLLRLDRGGSRRQDHRDQLRGADLRSFGHLRRQLQPPNTEGNSTVSLKGVCENRRGVCDYPVGLHYDPAGGCAKDFAATYTCGLDPTVRTVKMGGRSGRARRSGWNVRSWRRRPP